MKIAPVNHLSAGYAPELAKQISETHAGMAHFANSGPFARTCSECQHYGYWRQHRNQSGDLIKTVHRDGACGKFFELTRKHGPQIPANAAACRYFEPKP
jgi:hypothetical protein